MHAYRANNFEQQNQFEGDSFVRKFISFFNIGALGDNLQALLFHVCITFQKTIQQLIALIEKSLKS